MARGSAARSYFIRPQVSFCVRPHPTSERDVMSECAYCGEAAVTEDHIPAQALLPGVPRASRPAVPACRRCNEGASEDDEYFRDIVVQHHTVGEKPEAQPLLDKFLRALANPRKRGYAIQTLKDFDSMRVLTPSGIDLGLQPAYRVSTERLIRVVTRYVRGLHAHALGRTVPAERVHALVNSNWIAHEASSLSAMLNGGHRRVVKSGVFSYFWNHPHDEPSASVWLLLFFDALPFVGVVHPEAGVTRDAV